MASCGLGEILNYEATWSISLRHKADSSTLMGFRNCFLLYNTPFPNMCGNVRQPGNQYESGIKQTFLPRF